ncbi:hypothetical protein [Mesorhizobium sp.]|uniref:hypothetical protein n=1 Tax=Mesorhizobium sp. TaxID=1871066 RepID=UPI0012288BC4|nr:hypothetical protein [Mesorhizobium sp.]TIL29997.1 MAG: hypothetical protein E5Y85_25545 [Mesorhizobium sp.]
MAIELDPKIIEMLRDHPAQVGWLRTDLDRTRTVMNVALAALKRSTSRDARTAADELRFQIEEIDRSFAYLKAADEANQAEIQRLSKPFHNQEQR